MASTDAPSQETVVERLAAFAAGLGALAPEVEAAARRVLIDWFGAALAGSVVAPATMLRRALASELPGPARLLPDGAPAPPRLAALKNGTAAHAVEVDDIYSPGLFHPGAPIIPAALAAAEAEGASGARLLAGIVAGYEVGNRIARAINPAHYRFWHTTGTVGTFAAAAAAARVLGLDAAATAHALATAATFAAGLRQAFAVDAHSKPLHAGRAAEGGLLAALVAREGARGVADILEAPVGFGAALGGAADWGKALAGLGAEWTIRATSVKPWPCCGHTFAAIDAVRAALGGAPPEAVQRIRIGTYRAALDVCGNPAPETPYEAKFSLPFVAALAALGHDITPADFTAEVLADPAVRAMQARVELFLDAKAEAAFPARRGAVAEITLADGTTRRHRQASRRGDPDHAFPEAEIEAKFRRLAAPVIGETAAERLLAALRRVGELPRVTDIPMGGGG